MPGPGRRSNWSLPARIENHRRDRHALLVCEVGNQPPEPAVPATALRRSRLALNRPRHLQGSGLARLRRNNVAQAGCALGMGTRKNVAEIDQVCRRWPAYGTWTRVLRLTSRQLAWHTKP